MDKKGAWEARSVGRQRRNIGNAPKSFSDSDPAESEAPVNEEAAHPTPRHSLKHTRRFSSDNFEEEDIIVVPELVLKRSWMEQNSEPRSTAKKMAIFSKVENEGRNQEDDHKNGEDHFEDKQAAVSPSKTRE